MMTPGMTYLESGDFVPDLHQTVLIHPSLEWDVRCMLGFVPLSGYQICRLPVEGELGIVGPWCFVRSADPAAIKDIETLRSQIRLPIAAPDIEDIERLGSAFSQLLGRLRAFSWSPVR